jgi:AcrR family transcriptional regulator
MTGRPARPQVLRDTAGNAQEKGEPVAGDKPNGPRSKKGALTRARLLDAAKEIFEEDGFLDARISDIAERAGLSHGSFYHYFESKEAVFLEVAVRVDQRLSEPLGNLIFDSSSTAPRSKRLERAIRRHLEMYRDEARIMGVIEQVSRYDDRVKAVRYGRHLSYTDMVSESILQLQRRGLADPNLDPAVAAAGLGAMMYRFSEMWLVQGFLECTFEDAVEQLTLLFVNAMQLRDGTE